MPTKKSLLLTGFEPFGKNEQNPTQWVVENIEPDCKWSENLVLVKKVLPVTTDASGIVNSMPGKNFDFVVHLGLHGKIDDIAIERVALNIDDFRIPDNSGKRIRDKPIFPNGENAYFSKLPTRRIEENLAAEKIPCHISNSAGTYICNHLFYTTLHHVNENNLATKAGFVHVPSFEKMDRETLLRAVELVIESLFPQVF